MMDEKEIKGIVEECIEKVVEDFEVRPYMFYTEQDIHCYLYHLIYEKFKKQGIGECKTRDNKDTNILHKEYPPISKKYRKGRRRGAFDITILSPEYISNIYSVVRGKNMRDENDNPAFPFIAIELALDCDTDHLKRDYKKLTNKENKIENAYILHFIRDKNIEEMSKRKKKHKFSGLVGKVKRIRDEDKIKIWYVDVHPLVEGTSEPIEIKSESWLDCNV